MDSLLNGYEFVVVTDQANALTEQILSLREDLASAAGGARKDLERG